MQLLDGEIVVLKQRGTIRSAFDRSVNYEKNMSKYAGSESSSLDYRFVFALVRLVLPIAAVALLYIYFFSGEYHPLQDLHVVLNDELYGEKELKDAQIQGIVFFLLPVAFLIYFIARAKGSLIIITNQRVLLKRGFLLTDSLVCEIERIASVETSYSIVGRLLACGTLHFNGYGLRHFELPYMSCPGRIRDKIAQVQNGECPEVMEAMMQMAAGKIMDEMVKMQEEEAAAGNAEGGASGGVDDVGGGEGAGETSERK